MSLLFPQFPERLFIDFRLEPFFIDLSIGAIRDHILQRLVDLAFELCARILRIQDAEELGREGFVIIDDGKMRLGVLRLNGLHGCLIADQRIDLPSDQHLDRHRCLLDGGMILSKKFFQRFLTRRTILHGDFFAVHQILRAVDIHAFPHQDRLTGEEIRRRKEIGRFSVLRDGDTGNRHVRLM